MPNESSSNLEVFTPMIDPAVKKQGIKAYIGQIQEKYQRKIPQIVQTNETVPKRIIPPKWVIEETARLAELDPTTDPEQYRKDVKYLEYFDRSLYGEVGKNLTLPRSLTQRKIWALEDSMRKVEYELHKIDRLPIHKRILAVSSKRDLEQQLKDLLQEHQILQEDARIQAVKEDEKRNEHRKNDVKIISSHELDVQNIKKDFETIRDEYRALAVDVIRNTPALQEIRKGFIKNQIEPKLEELYRKGSLTAAEKTELVAEVIRFSQLVPDENLKFYSNPQAFYNKLQELSYSDQGMLRDMVECLINHRDQIFLEQFIFTMAESDINALKPLIAESSGISAFDIANFQAAVFSREDFNRDLMTTQTRGMNTDDYLYAYLKKEKIMLLKALKESPTMQSLFGDQIKQAETDLQNLLLEKSLVDNQGEYISGLIDFPSPEAIRNLVLIASADYQNYRTVNANIALKTLAAKNNWNQILDDAIRKYPDLVNTREVLQNWSYSEYSNYPPLVEVASAFSKTVFEDSRQEKSLQSLALEACPNEVVLHELVIKGVIDQKIADSIGRAQKYVQGFYKISGNSNDAEIRQMVASGRIDNATAQWFRETQANTIREDMGEIPFIGDGFFTVTLRRQLFSAFAEQADYDSLRRYLQRVSKVADAISGNSSDISLISFLMDEKITKILEDPGSNDVIDIMTKATAIFPGVNNYTHAISINPNLFLTEENIKNLKSIDEAYNTIVPEKKNSYSFTLVQEVAASIAQGKISFDRAFALTQEIPDLLQHYDASSLATFLQEYPKTCFSSSEATTFFRNVLKKYALDEVNNKSDVRPLINSALTAVDNEKISANLALAFPDNAPLLMVEANRQLTITILDRSNLLIKDISDIRFLNGLVGKYSNKSQDIINGYYDCLRAGVITTQDKDLVGRFIQQFRVVSPDILRHYKESVKTGAEQIFMSELKSLAAKLTGAGNVSESEKQRPYYKDLLKAIYSNNAGQWSSIEKNSTCKDRSSDLEDFEIRPNYKIDLMAAGEIKLKDGMSLDLQNIEYLKNNILGVAKKLESMGYEQTDLDKNLQQRLNDGLSQIVINGGFEGVDFEHMNVDEKLFLLAVDTVYGTKTIDQRQLKDLMIQYEFTNFEDIREYIRGTSDRVSRSTNADYSLLCELDNFYADRLKEVHRRIVESAWDNHTIAQMMPDYFKQISESSLQQGRQETINRLQVDKLGMTDGFLKQIARQMKEKNGRVYSTEQVRAILNRYEGLTAGLTGSRNINQEKIAHLRQLAGGGIKRTKEEITQSIYGQLKSQKDRTIKAAEIIGGETIDFTSVHLGEINLQQMLDQEAAFLSGKYDSDQFASYTVQKFIDLFITERTQLESELDKFVSASGKQRKVLNAYITKNEPSANARMVGGVCVSGDNPVGEGVPYSQNMWDQKNYFQLVLQDPDSLQCQGLVLLHHYEEGGKKILAASLNPASTYLYSVDEGAMFNGLIGSLSLFAEDNQFDKIVLSQNRAIRTNRTGGGFEREMNKRIAEVGEKFSFGSTKTFSFSPLYQLLDMDVVWNKPDAIDV